MSSEGDRKRRPGTGRPKKLSVFEQRDVILKVKRNPTTTTEEIRAELGKGDVSLELIRRHIREDEEMGSYWQVNKPFINAANRRKSLMCCKAPANWTFEQCRIL